MRESIGHQLYPDSGIELRPMVADDFAMLHGWLSDPGVSHWWDSPPPTVAQVSAKYEPRLAGSEPVSCLIACEKGRPFGLLQWYWLEDFPDHPGSAFVAGKWVAVDLLIGAPADRVRGLGRTMLRLWRTVLFAEYPEVVGVAIDPAATNLQAIAAYRRAGFVEIGRSRDPETDESCLIMVCHRDGTSDQMATGPYPPDSAH